jgi:hypothetical protein
LPDLVVDDAGQSKPARQADGELFILEHFAGAIVRADGLE